MSQLSLLLALAGLAVAPAPQDPQPVPQPEQVPQAGGQRGYGGIVGTQDARWMARSESRKVLGEFGGKALLDAWQGTWIWLSEQAPDEDVLMAAEDGRGVALNALCALSMSGNGSGIRSGAQRDPYRVLTRTLRALQDAESGAYVAKDAKEAALDQALAVHCMAEATITNPVQALFDHNQRGVDALLAMRGEDELWHVGGKQDGPVDALATGTAAYALLTALDAGAEIAPEVFAPIAAWSAEAKAQGDDEAERAVATVAILTARIFAHQGLAQGLKDDARVRELLAALDPWLPSPGSDAQPASDGLAARNDFAYLASVALYQADNVRWNRLFTWIAEHAVADTGAVPTGPIVVSANDGLPAAQNGRLPSGAVATTALRMLQLQSAFREPALAVFAN
ncbi:MAG TPA: hypothetical protein VMT18_15410 [Planctomycetota bacterium]|nr:hypothetical protein [Planctomycetota bacterium]